MLNIQATKGFTDIIHGSIPYSGIEREIIRTPLFNRLHKVLQNSLVYLTFPSNKVKRFEHSLGTMHLAGKMFFYSVCNTGKPIIDAFFEDVDNQINIWRENLDAMKYQYLHQDFFELDVGQIYNLERLNLPISKFYNQNMPMNIPDDKKFKFLIVFQAIRIAGLLHDVGHLPYSHILEKALKKLYLFTESKDPEQLTFNEKEFIRIFSPYFGEKNDELHEELGKSIVNIIQGSIASELGPSNKNTDLILFPLSFYFAEKILRSKPLDNDLFSDLHHIISGVVDADRLDYCSRDLFCSGVRKDIIDYEKFLDSFSIMNIHWDLDPGDRKRFIFCPSSRQIKEIEDLLYRRWRIFCDINYHHGVHKYELLMIECITELGKRNLAGSVQNPKSENPREIPYSIDGFWHIFNLTKKQKSLEALQYEVIQLDDSWLDTILRRYFLTLFPKPFSYSENADNVLWNRLNELISAKKYYLSVFKRIDDFEDFDVKFHDMFVKNEKIGAIIELVKMSEGAGDAGKAKETVPSLLAEFLEFVVNENYEKLSDTAGSFFFNRIEMVISKLLGDKYFFNEIEKIIPNLISNKDLDLIDVIIGQIYPKTGYDLKHPMFVNRERRTADGEVISTAIEITSVSNQSTLFKNERAYMPGFHLYFRSRSVNFNREALLSDVARHIAQISVESIYNYLCKEKENGSR